MKTTTNNGAGNNNGGGGGGGDMTMIILIGGCCCFCVILLAVLGYGYSAGWFEGLFTSSTSDSGIIHTDGMYSSSAPTDAPAPDPVWASAADSTFDCKVSDSKYGRWGWEGDSKGKCCDKNFQSCVTPAAGAVQPAAPPAGQCNVGGCDNWMWDQIVKNGNFYWTGAADANAPAACKSCPGRKRQGDSGNSGMTNLWKEGCQEFGFKAGDDINSANYLSIYAGNSCTLGKTGTNVAVPSGPNCNTKACVDAIGKQTGYFTTSTMPECKGCPQRTVGKNTVKFVGKTMAQISKQGCPHVYLDESKYQKDGLQTSLGEGKQSIIGFFTSDLCADNSKPAVAAGGLARRIGSGRARAGGQQRKAAVPRKNARPTKRRGGPSKPTMLRRKP